MGYWKMDWVNDSEQLRAHVERACERVKPENRDYCRKTLPRALREQYGRTWYRPILTMLAILFFVLFIPLLMAGMMGFAFF